MGSDRRAGTWQINRPGTHGTGQPVARERLPVGAAAGSTPVRPVGLLRPVDDGAPAAQPLVPFLAWARMSDALTADRDNQHPMIDGTIVRAHRQAAAGKRRAGIRRRGAPEGARHSRRRHDLASVNVDSV